jgi:hypothetical protein
MITLKLFRGSDIIGIVTNPEQEGPETVAGLEFTTDASKYKDLLNYMMNPKDTTQDPPPEYNFFEDWFIEDENGVMRPISPPAIYNHGEYLSWRWRR